LISLQITIFRDARFRK